jgi:hypothetical protein
MTWPCLTQNFDCLRSTFQVCQMIKNEGKKYGLLSPEVAESDPCVIVCENCVGPFTIRKPSKIYSLRTLTQ